MASYLNEGVNLCDFMCDGNTQNKGRSTINISRKFVDIGKSLLVILMISVIKTLKVCFYFYNESLYVVII